MGSKILSLTAIIFGTAFCFLSCSDLDNPKERNQIVFAHGVSAVEDSVNAMNNILSESNNKIYTYGIDVDMNNIDRDEKELFLYIDDNTDKIRKVGMITDSLLYTSALLEFLDTSQRKHFVNLALYLNANKLSGCSIQNNIFYYTYRADIYMADRQTDLDRFVIHAKSVQGIDTARYKILDNRNNLYLLANKDATIWSSK
jgi:hypothetical protein